MPTDDQSRSADLAPEVEAALDRYLDAISRDEHPDFEAAVAALPTSLRAPFRLEALVAEVLWFEGQGDPERVSEAYARCQDQDERERVRTAVEGAASAGGQLPAPLVVGETIFGRYQLLAELGRGGIGVVYLAYDVELRRQVAIKSVRIDPGRDVAAMTQNLIEESRTLAGLDEEGVVTVYDVLRDRERVCIVLALVEGKSLEDVIARLGALGRVRPGVRLEALRGMVGAEEVSAGPLAERSWYRAVAALVARVASALDAAHEVGVLHRDIKPGNIVLRPDGQPVLLDFGLASRLGSDESERFQGTPEYLAPEQIESYRIGQDRRTDVYALGLVLYELLARRRAFPRGAGEPLDELFARIVHRRFEPLREVDPGVPPVLARIVSMAIAKDPEARYARAGQLAEDLERWVGARAPVHAPVSPGMRLRLWLRRPAPWVAAVMIMTALLVNHFRSDEFGVKFFKRNPEQPAPALLSPGDSVAPGEILGAEVMHAGDSPLFWVSYWEDAAGELRVMPTRVTVDGVPPANADFGRSVGDGLHKVTVAKAERENQREGLMLFKCDDRTRADAVEEWFQMMDARIASNELGSLGLAEAERLFRASYRSSRGAALDPGDLIDIDWSKPVPAGQEIAKGIDRYVALYPVRAND